MSTSFVRSDAFEGPLDFTFQDVWLWIVKIFFVTVLLCILATSSSYLLLLLGPYHFCPLLSPSLHEMFHWGSQFS